MPKESRRRFWYKSFAILIIFSSDDPHLAVYQTQTFPATDHKSYSILGYWIVKVTGSNLTQGSIYMMEVKLLLLTWELNEVNGQFHVPSVCIVWEVLQTNIRVILDVVVKKKFLISFPRIKSKPCSSKPAILLTEFHPEICSCMTEAPRGSVS